MIVGWPDKSAKPNRAAADRIASTRTQHPCRSWIFACHTQRRAPNDILAPPARHYQPRPRRDIWAGKVTKRGRVQVVGWVIDDFPGCHAVAGGDPISPLALLPFVRRAIDRQYIHFLTRL